MDPSSSNHNISRLKQAHPNPLNSHHHNLCNNHGINLNSNNISSNSLLTGMPTGLSPSLPHQLSQLCNNQQHPLLALQQNFSHLLSPSFPDALQLSSTHSQATHETQFRNQRNSSNNNHNLYHHLHHHHQNHEYHPHHQRGHHNWRKSRLQVKTNSCTNTSNGSPMSLLDSSAKVVAEYIPFQSIEQKYQHIPEPVQRRIIFWSFPRHEDDIKMYSSLSSDTFTTNAPTLSATSTSNTTTHPPSSNSSFSWIDQSSNQGSTVSNQATTAKQNAKQLTFHKGLRLYDGGCVQDALQVGFNLSATVKVKLSQPVPTSTTTRNRLASGNAISQIQSNDPPTQNQVANVSVEGNASRDEVLMTKSHRVSVTFDRCKITSVSCSCELQDIFWCEHAVALIIHRIRNPDTIDLRVPISETLSNLDRQQLQKLVQYIIAEHHTEVLPTAQRLLDEMRQSYSEINQIQGAPDPTAGAGSDDEHSWHLDEYQVNEKVRNYLNSVASNSKEATKHIHALFEKIREMFRAKDSNGTRLLTLITEQFLSIGTKSEKHRPLWDQLTFLWVVETLKPDLTRSERGELLQALNNWSRHSKCPKEDLERRICIKRKVLEASDDEEIDDQPPNLQHDEYSVALTRKIHPAHMATHRRNFQTNHSMPILRPYNQISVPSSGCPCHLPHSSSKKLRTDSQHNISLVRSTTRTQRPSNSSVIQNSPSRVGRNVQNSSDARSAVIQEPRSIFHRALDFMDVTWDDPHLQLILNNDGPLDFDPAKSHLVYYGYPLWYEPMSQAAARIETLRSYGYREQALRLTVASVRRLKLQQEHMNALYSPDHPDLNFPLLAVELDSEAWIGHPFDPVNVMLDLLLSASTTESTNYLEANSLSSGLCSLNMPRCTCPYNQALFDFTQRIFPDIASLTYPDRSDVFPLIPLVNPARRPSGAINQSSSDGKKYIHVPVPGCCQKDSYLTLAFELALTALSQQRPIPSATTAHDRAVRQEADLISRLETIDISDPILIKILERQTTLLLEGELFHNSCCGSQTDFTPLHTFAKYLFESLVPYYPPLAYKVGVHALKMPLTFDENIENIGAARAPPRYTINQTHLQNEQLILAQTMLSRAKEEKQFESFLRKVYRASVKNIRSASNLLKLSKHALKEAKAIKGCQPHQPLLLRFVLQTAFDLGSQVLKMTLNAQSTNSKSRRDAIQFIVECATDVGLESVLQVMKEARDNFTPIEALSLVISRESDTMNNIRTQAMTKLNLKDCPNDEARLNRRSRDLALECATRDPTNCALEAIKFCEIDDESLKKALKIVIDAGSNGIMDSTQLIKVADHIHDRGMTDRAFDISMVAVDGLTSSSNLDNPSAKKDIFSACEYASKVNGFSILIPKLLNIESAYVLSDIYQRFSPPPLIAPAYRYSNDMTYHGSINYNKDYNALINSIHPEIYKQKLEDLRWWDAMLKRTMKSFVDTTRSKLQNISPRHYGEFIEFLAKAQTIFEKATDGPKQFKDLIAEIVKSYRTKKKLMEKLKGRFQALNISVKL